MLDNKCSAKNGFCKNLQKNKNLQKYAKKIKICKNLQKFCRKPLEKSTEKSPWKKILQKLHPLEKKFCKNCPYLKTLAGVYLRDCPGSISIKKKRSKKKSKKKSKKDQKKKSKKKGSKKKSKKK